MATKAPKPRLALFFKDFAAWVCDASCIGLHVAGYTTANYLKSKGVDVSVFPVRHNVDLVDALKKYDDTHRYSISHAVISAPWISAYDVIKLLEAYPNIMFVILSHSNVGFLQADPGGVELFRKYADISKSFPNLSVGGNSSRFTNWFEAAYGKKCVCLPNLYPVKKVPSKCWHGRVPIKIGAFGAVRAEKNFMTAAAAALVIRKALGLPVELHMTTGGEVRQSMVLAAIREMTNGVPGFLLVDHKWKTWDHFIQLVGQMDMMIQVSYSESFNMITADGISVGVPSVVSPAIYWAPKSWRADPDNAVEVAEVGVGLLNVDQGRKGFQALNNHNSSSLHYWTEFLET